MSIAIPFLALLFAGAFAAYHRLRLAVGAALTATLLVACWLLGANPTATAIAAAFVALIAGPLLLPQVRKRWITAPLLGFYARVLPPLSETERVALESGTVGFEGELFSGKPDWDMLLSQPKPELRPDEQAFLDGPCEELCRMTDDWQITHVNADLTPEIWEYLKKNRFFGMIVPKEYADPIREGTRTLSSMTPASLVPGSGAGGGLTVNVPVQGALPVRTPTDLIEGLRGIAEAGILPSLLESPRYRWNEASAVGQNP